MHADELKIDQGLVCALLEINFPQWAHLPLRAVVSSGTDNALFRLGSEMVVRMPRIASAALQIEKEVTWLPHFSGLSLQTPMPLAIGRSGCGYPWTWSVYRWLDGDQVSTDAFSRRQAAAETLADFILGLRAIDVDKGPLSGKENHGRGVPLRERDHLTCTAIEELRDEFDTRALTTAWRNALRAAPWDKSPVWLHGDIHAGNLLSLKGKLTAVIDFGLCGVGDPACDLMIAWSLFEGKARNAFRKTLGDDDATWARGRGWALSVALIALAYYRRTNQSLSDMSRRTIAAVLKDFCDQANT